MRTSGTSGKPAQPIGISAVLWPLALVAWGVYGVARPGPSRVWDWVMIVGGTVLALLGLLAWRTSPTRGAKSIDQLNRELYGGVHQRRVVDESTIAAYGLDMGFYQRTTLALGQLGFRRLKDIVDVETEQTWLQCRAVIRTFLSGDGTTMVGVYHARFGGWVRLLAIIGLLPRKHQITDFETELSDGTFVTTSDASSAGKTSEFPGVSRLFLTPGVSTADLWAAHMDHLGRELAGRQNGVTAVVMRTYEDLGASQDRLQLLKCEYRNSAMFDPAAECARVSGKPLTPEQQAMADETARLHRERVAKEYAETAETDQRNGV